MKNTNPTDKKQLSLFNETKEEVEERLSKVDWEKILEEGRKNAESISSWNRRGGIIDPVRDATTPLWDEIRRLKTRIVELEKMVLDDDR